MFLRLSITVICSVQYVSLIVCCRSQKDCLRRMAVFSSKNNYTVPSLLEAAGTRRKTGDCGSNETDHVVELQLVVAALNTLPRMTYTREGWQRELMNFFNQSLNLQCIKRDKNQEKGQAVRKFIQGGGLMEQEAKWIRLIRQHWSEIKHRLTNFVEFKAALDAVLARV